MQFFQRKFAVTSVIEIYWKMWELCMHPDYDHLYIPLTFKQNKFQPQTNIFSGNTTLFLLSLLSCGSRFLKKKKHKFFQFEILLPQASKQKETYFATRKILQNFEGHDHWHCCYVTFELFTIFQSGQNNGVEIWAFPDKVTPDIDFTDEAVAQCDVPVVKMLL